MCRLLKKMFNSSIQISRVKELNATIERELDDLSRSTPPSGGGGGGGVTTSASSARYAARLELVERLKSTADSLTLLMVIAGKLNTELMHLRRHLVSKKSTTSSASLDATRKRAFWIENRIQCIVNQSDDIVSNMSTYNLSPIMYFNN